MNCRGTDPPTTLSTNSNPEPSGNGSTSISHTAYWPCPPDCLTWRPWPFALPPKVSRSGTRSSHRVHRDAVPVGQRVEHNAGMSLAHAPEHDLVCFLVLLDAQCRVFGGQPSQPDRQLVFVGLGVRLNGDRQQRLRHRPGFQHERLGLVRERVAGFGPAQLADRADVARHHGRRGALLLAERERQNSDAFVFVMVGMGVASSRWTPPKNDAKWPDT